MRSVIFILLVGGCGSEGTGSGSGGSDASGGGVAAGEGEEEPGSDGAPGGGEGEGEALPAGEGEGEVGDAATPPGEGEGEGEPAEEALVTWSEGPYGHAWHDSVGDFTFPEEAGDWSFREHFDGRDAYVFVGFAEGVGYVEGLWRSNVRWLLQDSPPNVHYFFYAMPDRSGRHRVFEFMQPIADGLADAFERLEPGQAEHWRTRVHLLGAPVITMTGWLKEAVVDNGRLLFAVDRFQRLRQTGLLGNPGQQSFVPELHWLANEVKHFNFEFERERDLAARPADVVPILDAHAHGGGWGGGHGSRFTVELPSAQALAEYDTAELDMRMRCADRDDDNCPEWDHTAHLYICEWQTEEGGADPVEEACEPGAERECACGSPSRGEVVRSRVCNEEGAAWSHCRCGCGDELGRWITTYHREGRWVTDITQLLPSLPGGTVDMRYTSPNGQEISVDLRLSKQERGGRPASLLPLFGGGGFRPGSNDRYEPLAFTAPEGTTRVELVTMITGHGFGHDRANCAEFCNHTHHFRFNGEAEFVKAHPEAGTPRGCVEQIADGVVPNQYGTWPFGRGGWCPGLDVKPWVVDVTEAVDLAGDNEVSYEALLDEREYVPRGQTDGFNPSISMSSWLVFWR